MEENGSISKSNWANNYKNGGKATNKATISYTKAAKDHYCWEHSTGQESFGDGGDLVSEFSWPPRSYTCTFCKREFRSAQALGGHMNVHRREKARLRQITPPRYLPPSSRYFSSNSKLLDLNLDPNPNPNPNISTCFASNASSFPTMFPPFTYSSMSPAPLILPSPSSVQPYSCFLPAPCPFHHMCPSDSANFTTMRYEKSDLTSGAVDDVSHENMNLILKKSESTSVFVESKLDDMDLELRLGCS